MSDRTDLYRLFDERGRLLYVGISCSAIGRAAQHRSEKGWWSQVARMDVVHYPTREAAAEAEITAIRAEHPAFNIAGKRDDEEAAPMVRRTDSEAPSDPLVGRFFLTPDVENGGWPLQQNQGHVEGRVSDDLYLVQLYSWLSGEPTALELRHLDEMTGWHFYTTVEDWHEAGEKGMRARDRWTDQQQRLAG